MDLKVMIDAKIMTYKKEKKHFAVGLKFPVNFETQYSLAYEERNGESEKCEIRVEQSFI